MKSVRMVSFAEDIEEIPEKHVMSVNPASPYPLKKVEERIARLETAVEETKDQVAQILKLLQSRSPVKGHAARDCPEKGASKSPSPRKGTMDDPLEKSPSALND